MKDNENSTRCNGKLTPYEWQRAILASDLPSTTKLVLMALSTHINKGTGLAFPSIRMLMKDTGLSNKAVIKHLRGAERAGWIETGNYGYFDQRWARKSYRPQIPVNLQGGERRTPPFDVKVVNIVPEGGERHSQGGERHSQGGERRTPPFDAKNALEPAPVLACGDSQTVPPLINKQGTRKEREGATPLPTPPDSLSVSSNSSQDGETSKVGGNVEAATAQSAGGNSGLGCQSQAVGIATKASGKPTTGRERQHQGNGVAQPTPVPRPPSDDDIKAAMQETCWGEARVKDEAPKFRDYHLSKGTLSCDWRAEGRIWKRRGDEWESRERERMRANGKVERTAPKPPIFVAEPRVPIDPSKPRPSHMPTILAEIARATAQS
jgi:hypothetical protein